jgi:transposase
MLIRVFLGWLRGERGHCGMVAIPTIEEEDARRPNRERESLVNERSRIINRMKSALVSRDNLDENGGGNQGLKRRPVARS